MRRKTLTDEQIALVEKLATRGSHEHTFAFHLGISTPTWRRLRDTDKKVRAAYERGRGKLHDYCFGRMLEHSERTFVPAWIVLKSVFGYREEDPQADSGPQVNIINLGAPLSPEEWAQRRQALTLATANAEALPAPAEKE